MIGYLIGPATWPERGLLLVASLLLIRPGLVTDVVGLGLLGGVFALQRARPAPHPVATTPTEGDRRV